MKVFFNTQTVSAVDVLVSSVYQVLSSVKYFDPHCEYLKYQFTINIVFKDILLKILIDALLILVTILFLKTDCVKQSFLSTVLLQSSAPSPSWSESGRFMEVYKSS